jgi:hypothetical protein
MALPEEDGAPVDERSHSFVIRIWEEQHGEQGGAGQIWRGCLEEVRSGSRVYFSTLLELCEHLGKRTGMVSPRENWRDRFLARSRHWRTGGLRGPE